MIPIIAIAIAAVGVAGIAAMSGRKSDKLISKKLPAKRMPKDSTFILTAEKVANNPAIDPYNDVKPVYIKSLGSKKFYVGACYDQWMDAFQERCKRDGGTTECLESADEWIIRIANLIEPGVGDIVKWLLERGCLRIRAKMHAYEYNGKRYWRVGVAHVGETKFVDWQGRPRDLVGSLVEDLKQEVGMPLSKKSGYKRAWLLPSWPTGTRNKDALMMVWAYDGNEGNEAVLQEIVPEDELRRMLLLIAGTGAFTREDLSAIDDDNKNRHWAPSVKSQVENEFPGLGDD